MRALIAALILTLAIAVSASVFAIWPVVTDAPWENDFPAVDMTREIRCEAALQLRNELLVGATFNDSLGTRLKIALDLAGGYIDDSC